MTESYFTSALTLLLLLFTVAGSNSSVQEAAEGRGSGQDITLVYQISFKESQGLKPAGSMTLYFSDDAVRSELDIELSGQRVSVIMLGHTDRPEEAIVLNAQGQTYSKIGFSGLAGTEMVNRTGDMPKSRTVSTVNEEINRYSSTQIELTSPAGEPSESGTVPADNKTGTMFWMSKEIPGYEKYQRLLEVRPEFLSEGIKYVYQYGFPAKQEMLESGEVMMRMELKSANTGNIPMNKFNIPEGFDEI